MSATSIPPGPLGPVALGRTTVPSPADPDDATMIRATRAALDLLLNKWTVDLLYLLASGTRRYSRLYERLDGISKKVLTQSLRALERNGLVARRVFAEVPTRVEYSLTPLGWSLTAPLMSLYEWSAEHIDEVEVARTAYAAHAAAVAAAHDGEALVA